MTAVLAFWAYLQYDNFKKFYSGGVSVKDGFVKVAVGTPEVRVADCVFNMERTLELVLQASEQGVALAQLTSPWYSSRFAWGRRPLAEAGLG